mmetsp:Transcript_26854/g.86278  ORF Transcript_26854/g.86278 Transcript_26854/m.86278 type:complete len:209 (-) Transcript_26854:284-910(-)
MCSSITSTTRSRNGPGFMRPASSNSCHAFATEDWLVVQGILIQRASRRSSLTALKDCEPPFTCSTAAVRPCVGRTLPVLRGSQSIWFLKTPVRVPCISGETHTCASDQSDSARSSLTFGWSSSDGSRTGRPCGLKTRTSAPIASSSRAHSWASRRLKELSRREPYKTSTRGACASLAPAGRKSRAASSMSRGSQSSPAPELGKSRLAR